MLRTYTEQIILSVAMVTQSRKLIDAGRRDRDSVKVRVEAGREAIIASRRLLDRIDAAQRVGVTLHALKAGVTFVRMQGVIMQRLVEMDGAPFEYPLDRFRWRAQRMQ